jgi:hypothetical protein
VSFFSFYSFLCKFFFNIKKFFSLFVSVFSSTEKLKQRPIQSIKAVLGQDLKLKNNKTRCSLESQQKTGHVVPRHVFRMRPSMRSARAKHSTSRVFTLGSPYVATS